MKTEMYFVVIGLLLLASCAREIPPVLDSVDTKMENGSCVNSCEWYSVDFLSEPSDLNLSCQQVKNMIELDIYPEVVCNVTRMPDRPALPPSCICFQDAGSGFNVCRRESQEVKYKGFYLENCILNQTVTR
jgi:hypothetical protein